MQLSIFKSGEKDRAPIEQGVFDTFKKVANQEIAKMVWTGQWDPSKQIMLPRKFWSKGAGIIGCQNQASVNFMVELKKTIKWPGKVFKCWRQGEYGSSTLVTIGNRNPLLKISLLDGVKLNKLFCVNFNVL